MSEVLLKDNRIKEGLTYNEFVKEWENYLANTDPEKLDQKEEWYYGYKKLNLHRSKRIHKTYQVDGELEKMINNLPGKQKWMLLTEDWCGDSAQVLPHIAMMVDQTPDIELRILRRDDNPEIMDTYLTNGARSIPKLVAFDDEGIELFQWGPRPRKAQEFVKEELSKERDKQEVYKELHSWYSRDRGKEIEKEFKEILSNLY